MAEKLHQDTTTVGEWGNSLGLRIKKIYADLAGIEKETEVTQAVMKGKHGIFIGIWLPEEQPESINDANLEEIKSLNGDE